MEWLIDEASASDVDYLMFILHSSELMPGGSPTFRNDAEIDRLYQHMESIFQRISRIYMGVTLEEYYTGFQI